MRKRTLLSVIMFVSLGTLWITPTNAQDVCEALVRRAMSEAGNNCTDVAVNSACYGFGGLVMNFFIEQVEEVFSRPGSLVDLPLVQSVQTNGLDIDEEDWGIAYFRVVLEGTTEEEPAVLIMMGDVTIENAVDPSLVEDGTAPLEQLYFSTGVKSECALAPNRLMVQSPAGRTIKMSVNEVPVSISSTAMFGFNNVDAGNVMYVQTVDGAVRINPDSPQPTVVRAGTTTYAPITEQDENGRYVVDEESDFIEPLSERDMEELGFFEEDYFDSEELLPEDLLNYSLEEEDLDELYDELVEGGYCFGYDSYEGDCGDLADWGELEFSYDGYYFDEDADYAGYDYDSDGYDAYGEAYDGNPYLEDLEDGDLDMELYDMGGYDPDLYYDAEGYDGTAFSNPYFEDDEPDAYGNPYDDPYSDGEDDPYTGADSPYDYTDNPYNDPAYIGPENGVYDDDSYDAGYEPPPDNYSYQAPDDDPYANDAPPDDDPYANDPPPPPPPPDDDSGSYESYSY